MYISSNYGFLSETIIKPETSGHKLVKQIKLLITAIEALNSVTGSSANLNIAKNDGFKDLKSIAIFLNEKI